MIFVLFFFGVNKYRGQYSVLSKHWHKKSRDAVMMWKAIFLAEQLLPSVRRHHYDVSNLWRHWRLEFGEWLARGGSGVCVAWCLPSSSLLSSSPRAMSPLNMHSRHFNSAWDDGFWLATVSSLPTHACDVTPCHRNTITTHVFINCYFLKLITLFCCCFCFRLPEKLEKVINNQTET